MATSDAASLTTGSVFRGTETERPFEGLFNPDRENFSIVQVFKFRAVTLVRCHHRSGVRHRQRRDDFRVDTDRQRERAHHQTKTACI